MVKGATAQIEHYAYRSNWAVANHQYDVCLGVPWHNDLKPVAKNENKEIAIHYRDITRPLSTSSNPMISNLGVSSLVLYYRNTCISGTSLY